MMKPNKHHNLILASSTYLVLCLDTMTWSISVDHFSEEKVLEDDEEKMVLIVSSTLATTLYNKRERERETVNPRYRSRKK